MGRYHCPLCGWQIYGSRPMSSSWNQEFRGLCRCSISNRTNLTGVGKQNSAASRSFFAPLNPTGRYDDPGYRFSEQDVVGTHFCEINNKFGFPVHNICWKLLEEAIYPSPVPIERLFDVLKSFVWPSLCVDGRLDWRWREISQSAECSSKDSFPWDITANASTANVPPFTSDPYFVDLHEILSERYGVYDVPLVPDNLLSGLVSGNDPFLSLPEELCSVIACYLPLRDALHARLASRSFWHLFDRQQFWRSQFMGLNSELSCLFELHRDPYQGARDWRLLYHRITDTSNDSDEDVWSGLRNRGQAWQKILTIVDILELCPTPNAAFTKRGHLALLKPRPDCTLRVGGSAAESLVGTVGPLQVGCFRKSVQSLAIPNETVRIPASTIDVGSFTYISGLTIVSNSQTESAGHLGPKEKERSVTLNAADLRGLNVAVGLRGIHALQFADSAGLTPWLGDPHDAAKTTRLGSVSNISSLEVWSDAFRIVEIGIVKKQSSELSDTENISDLRIFGIWYPDIPPSQLNLNEECFFSAKALAEGFRPLFWTHFGGPGGVHLKSLLRIYWDQPAEIITFAYENKGVPLSSQSFGRAPELEWDDDSSCFEPDTQSSTFVIDGPGGERITAVETCQKYRKTGRTWECTEGVLTGFEVFTNQGRSHLFRGVEDAYPEDWRVETKRLEVPPGSVVTGLYGFSVRNLGYGLAALGIITELEA
ncbi:uncharacterized protein QC763_511110 [Podospora pseudopauciseta]|uniref:F-box domain-containing protein n=1 Tax=Podospora pseudopauciseta TaxID=2093780 RepID=A0ABR0HB92_9PEZI|nr:hypothetical protein QC763_511110 [Podospora pseudopauciseta]